MVSLGMVCLQVPYMHVGLLNSCNAVDEIPPPVHLCLSACIISVSLTVCPQILLVYPCGLNPHE